jgi:hypothetical protein
MQLEAGFPHRGFGHGQRRRAPVDVHACADSIVIRPDGRIVAEHPRAFGRKRLIYELTA